VAGFAWNGGRFPSEYPAGIPRNTHPVQFLGSSSDSRPENKVSLGFVEGLNNKIRVIQRRAYGLRDEKYLRLKILTWMLKEI
jgi:hypothetical protein